MDCLENDVHGNRPRVFSYHRPHTTMKHSAQNQRTHAADANDSLLTAHTNTQLLVWRVEHGYHAEHSIILSLTRHRSSCCPYSLPHPPIPPAPSAKPSFFTLSLFLSSTLFPRFVVPLLPSLSFHDNRNEPNSSGRRWLSGEAGGLTCFYTSLMSSEPQTTCSQEPQTVFNILHVIESEK